MKKVLLLSLIALQFLSSQAADNTTRTEKLKSSLAILKEKQKKYMTSQAIEFFHKATFPFTESTRTQLKLLREEELRMVGEINSRHSNEVTAVSQVITDAKKLNNFKSEYDWLCQVYASQAHPMRTIITNELSIVMATTQKEEKKTDEK